MNRTEHLLVCLAEECAEVQQAISKALRFGLDDKSPAGHLPANREYIAREICDVIGVLGIIQDEGIIPPPEDWPTLISAKQDKVRRFMDYAIERGTLDASPSQSTGDSAAEQKEPGNGN